MLNTQIKGTSLIITDPVDDRRVAVLHYHTENGYRVELCNFLCGWEAHTPYMSELLQKMRWVEADAAANFVLALYQEGVALDARNVASRLAGAAQ